MISSQLQSWKGILHIEISMKVGKVLYIEISIKVGKVLYIEISIKVGKVFFNDKLAITKLEGYSTH